MNEKIGCVPSAGYPFGMPYEISLIVDQRLHQSSQLLYITGYPDRTVGILGSALKSVLSELSEQIFEVSHLLSEFGYNTRYLQSGNGY